MTTFRLVVRRTIRATPERLFALWTQPEHLTKWWGPSGVSCPSAEVDLRVGGAYRIANRFPDGEMVYITGEFRAIEPPRRLVYTWQIGEDASPELVTVTFAARDPGSTEVTVTHERIADDSARAGHERGWEACLDGLAEYAAPGPAPA